jgi:hypothetical protein
LPNYGSSVGEWACGPLRPGVPFPAPTTSSSSSGAGGAGGAGGGTGGAGASGGGGAAPISAEIQCCYGRIEPHGPQGCGRPLVVEGIAVTSPTLDREGWRSATASNVTDLPPWIREELALRWARDAALEHASVASFARFVLDLLSVSAPADLVSAAGAAMRDEIQHAELCYSMASRHAGRALGPGPLPLAGVALGGTLVDVALRALVEGAIGETVAAIVAARTLGVTTDPEARAALTVIARDEATHAELAFRFLAWAAREEEVRRALHRALPAAIDSAVSAARGFEGTRDDAIFEANGQPGGELRARASREAILEVAGPCLSALLDARRWQATSCAPAGTREIHVAAGTGCGGAPFAAGRPAGSFPAEEARLTRTCAFRAT